MPYRQNFSRAFVSKIEITAHYRYFKMLNVSFISQSLHRSESMLSVACFKTLSQLANSENPAELQQYLASNSNINLDDKDEVRNWIL